ncbi:hypothetical protein Godav_025548, partial [Gossypium davidsonii]|nr:hypothetical protein [Gossypium davidsonii]MBA0644895.1 hypothetical protein [Gossypium klotzschianum]
MGSGYLGLTSIWGVAQCLMRNCGLIVLKQLRTFKKVLWRVPTLHWLGEFISCCHDLAI